MIALAMCTHAKARSKIKKALAAKGLSISAPSRSARCSLYELYLPEARPCPTA